MALTFNEARHRYELDGKRIPSVTTILGVINKPGLPYWAAKLVAEEAITHHSHWGARIDSGEHADSIIRDLKSAPWRQRDDAANRGTRIHTVLEAAATGDPTACPTDLMGMATAAIDLLDRLDLQPTHTEARLYNREHWYAGTADLIATIGGETWLLDWKSSRSLHDTHIMQLEAYAHAETILDEEGDERPMPTIDRLGIIHLTDSSATLHDAGTPGGPGWATFQAANTIHQLQPHLRGLLK